MRIGAGYNSAREFAAALEVNENTYARYERGSHEPSYNLLCLICDKLSVTPNDLLGFRHHVGKVISSIGFFDIDLSQTVSRSNSEKNHSRGGRRSQRKKSFVGSRSHEGLDAQVEAIVAKLARDYVNATPDRGIADCATKQDRVSELVKRLKADAVPTVAWMLATISGPDTRRAAQVRIQSSASTLIRLIVQPGD